MPVIVVNDENTRRSKATRAQREIFSIEQTHQEVRCNLWFYKHIRGAFDLETLENAIKRLTSRVPLLQTRFVYSDGELWQIYDKSIQHNLKTIDVRTHSTPFEEALRRMKKTVNQSGGMTDDHLCEFTVYSIDDTNYILYARFHHSIIDIRSWAKFESLLVVVYNDLKNGNKITVQPKLHFGALSHADTIYQASDEYEKDETFWQAYVQPLKRLAYTQRCINSAGKKTTHRHKMPLCIGERRKLQKLAAAMNIPESFLYVGVSALLLRSILGREHVSLSLPVNGTDLTNELGMTFNVVPLLLHIPEDATIHEALLRIAQETKSILKHQRYRIEDILKLANYSSNASFGPHVNIMCSDHGEKLSGCSCSSHFGGNTDINDLQITFWADRPNGRLDILLEDIHEGHSEQQLATLSEHMSFILDQVLYATNSTVATLDEQCGDVTTVELSESFYANRRKPIAAGFLQWSQSCDVLIRLVYSNTWVGSGDSPFAATKVLLSDRAVSISKLERVVDSVCKKAPGTVLKIEESAWHVAAADGVVKMTHFLDEFGQTISARTLANQCHIIEGGQLPIVKPEQIEWLGEAHTQAMMAHPPARCLHQLFEAQVERNGQAIAVECEGRTLSYTELNAQANQLAHYLVARGVEPDDRIALCVERSTTMIVAMLGIMKAGGAYVPLDPAYPSQRLNHILQDADPIFLLADATGRNALGDHQVPLLDIQDQALFASLPADNPDSTKLGLSSSHLAYVIYTSGSTGTPKGVMIEHRSLFSLVQTIPRFEVSPNSRVLQFASCSFDNSIWEIVLALTTGARLCMPNVEERLTDTALLKYIKAKGITHADLGPSLFRNTKNLSDLNGMKVLILGSEAPNLSLISAASRQTVVYNVYGLTETTVNATFWLCPKDFDGDSVPMGRPLPSHCLTYVLDSNGEPVQPGVEGELYIGGAGLARGYLNRPELTVERFLPDPFSVQPEARMYRTGDRARYLPDGNLVYLGRIDQQVKIRGFRIELGEIEAHLVEHPQVHAAVVQPYGNGSEARLVAYVVAKTDTSLAQDLRTYLSTLLPDYMVPVAYVRLRSLPLTPNGKLDRRALPAPHEESFAREKYEAPQGEMEEKMANIWRELLGIERIGRYDNFFALGGHSLLIVRLLAELRRIGLDTTVREVFNAPTLSKLASTIIRYHALTIPPNLISTASMKITPEMLPLINLTQAEIDTIVAQVPGGVANIQDIYGLAPLQNGMLFHHMKAERGDPYLVISRMVFTDKTALIRYAAALQQVIERHDILRTVFIWKGLNEPAQVVLRQVPSLLTEVTMDDTSDTVLEQLSHRFDPRHYRLDLTKAPLLRLIAAPTSEGSWVVLQLLHHTIADHSTDDILAEEIHAIFDGQFEKLPTPTSFRNVVAQARLGANPVEYKRFFNQMLGDINEPTLPFGLSDVGLDGTMINGAHLMLPQTLNDQLRAIARKLQVNLASICHLAWAQVLARASGREAIVFGTVLIGRLQTGEENNNIMGPMINTLPIRIDVDETSVEIAVRNTHARLSALLAHEQAPLALAQRCSEVPADLPLFSATLNYVHNQRTGKAIASLPGINVIDEVERTNYPLFLAVEDDGESLGLTSQVISPMSADRIGAYMHQALVALANALTHEAQQSFRKLTIIPPEERTLLLHSWNQTTITYPSEHCLHQLFQAQVERDGEAIAVECKGYTLTYSELNAQANRLAHYLIARGVKPDERIALCTERNTTMIVAMLGILKAGGAYVPIDPTYTSQRLINILQDADPKFLLTDATGRKVIENHKVPMVDLDKSLPVDLPIDNPDADKLRVTPNNLAYIIYTSGSTGTPKGVMVEHRDATHLFKSVYDKFDFNNEDKWCLFHSISFDVSVWEIWGALSNGSQLSIVPYKISRSMDDFYNWICSTGITVLTQTPSVFKMLMRAETISSQSDRLRYVIFGGEALDPFIIRDWHEKCTKNRTVLVNMYGPTETVMIATSWICDVTLSDNLPTPIGRPLPNKKIYLLDPHGELVPLGAEGELYIGGAGVARGYLNRPELTAERFLPDPFSDNAEARMYRTGDRARYLPDGNMVYLGRTDQQVKIRGFRIELGEIEAHLVKHPQVHEAVVQPCANGSDARLVAYVVADTDTSLAQNLRSYLLNLLPDYMVPAAYVCLSSLPLTTNGKLDRRALPVPDEESFAHEKYEAPQGEMEEKMANIWCELLGIDRISRHDNFFALGGHSLLVVRLLAELRRIGLDTTVSEVFNVPTLTMLTSNVIRYQAVTIPSNLITADSTAITPEMLPLINLTQAEIDTIVEQIPGGVANIQDIYGLAPLQHGMLFHHIKAEWGDPYLLVSRMQFIDRTTLESYADVLQQVILRHDILRTVFIWKGLSEPAQVVLRQVPSLLSEVTLDGTNDTILEQLSQQFNPRHYRLDLTKAPLLRLIAAPTSEGNWVALQLMHHIIGDHSTLENLWTEFESIIEGNIEKLTTPTSFRYVVAQTRLGINPAQHTRFFTKMLSDIDEPTLPFGLSDVEPDGTEINEVSLMLSQSLNDQLRMLARNLQVSLASICHLAWAQVLARASGREAVVFGTVLLGRLQTGEENNNIMGPMINTLPIRIDIDETSVETAVQRTHARLSSMLAHEHAPLVLAQQCSGVPAGMPLFSALLNYRHNQKAEEITSSLPGVTFLDGEERTNYPLAISVEDYGDSLGLTPQTISSLSAARIGAFMQQALESLADALAHKPQQPVRTLTVIPPEERTLLLHAWNETTVNYPSERCLHQLFEAQVKRDQQATAVEYKGETLTYAELNAQANQLANYLIARSIKRDDLVALCVERSTKMIVAMLGIMKAGGAYVPLDPAYPSQRLNHILQDANPKFLLADATGRKVLGEHEVPVVDLDKPLPADFPMDNPDAKRLGVTPTNLAYVIYTSGSTGTPKGVMVEHYDVAQLLQSVHGQFDFNNKDKWCFFHSISFDISVWEIWGALLNGSQISIVPYNTTRSMDKFYDWICSTGITVLSQTPSVFKMLMRAENINLRFDRLRYVFFGGEALDPLILSEWFEKFDKSNTVLANIYGPTETAIIATGWICDNQISENSLIPIGRPVPNKRIYLLDSHGEPVPLGVEGELYVGGTGMARGYLNRSELTAERFLSDPFSEKPSARMYRTGDRARYLPDGNLIYLGRTDQQVKIRGFRIELGEIEAHLVEHPQVHQAVVQPYGNGSDARLVAYVVANADTSLAQDLRTFLSNLLPEYMVPGAFVCLPSLPLTPNGKLDRRALPPPDDEAFVRQQYEAPQGEMEEKLADIWSELLGIDRISRHDNFFALGGHSLLVVRLLAQLRNIGLETTVQEVFNAPTLAMLTTKLAHYQAVQIPPNLITTDSIQITPEMLPLINLTETEIDTIVAQVPGGVANIKDIYGLAPLQHGMLFHHIKSECGDPYLIVNRMQFSDRTALERYATAFQQVVDRHDVLRTVFIWEGLSEPAQVVLRQVPSILNEIILEGSEDSILKQLIHRFDTHHYRLDLTQAPLLRLMASPTTEGSWVALQLIHHSIIDNSTLERLTAEVQAIIDGKVENLETPKSFRDLVAHAQLGVSSDEHTRFFSEMLGDIDEPFFPFGLSDVGLDGTELNEGYLTLPQTLNHQLRAHARKLQVSLSSIFHLAWAQVLARASRSGTVVFGTVLLGRLQTGDEIGGAIIGPMINTLPIRIDINETSVENAVRNTHARLSALLIHEHAPLVLAQRCSGVPAGLSLFSALLNYRHNQKIEQVPVTLPGVSFLGDMGRTNYPLTMSLDDNDDTLCLSVQVVSPMSAARICAYMQQALKSLAEALTYSVEQPIRTLTVMPPEERTLLLHTWNQTAVDYPSDRCIHQLFEAQVERNGQAIAVEWNEETLSYAELNAKANQLAHYLNSRGVKPNDRIALCIDRNTTMIVAMLGILKAGGAYVPLDPAYQSQRLTHILQDANPILLLADATGRNAIGDHDVPVIDLDVSLPADLPTDNPDATNLGVNSTNLIYVIYTSGSTGTPKGVMVEHQHTTQLLQSVHDKFDFNTQDKWCLFHSFSFDFSVWEIWGALCYGSQLSIVPYDITRSMDEFYNWICASGITVLNQTPSAFRMLLRAKDISSCSDHLRYVIFGGEALDPLIVNDWFDKYTESQTVLVNMYGPTETVVFATSWICDNTISENSMTPIGRPLSNKRIYLLNQHGEPVPLEAEGELYIGGAGVARGYLNRPELTAERFLPDPFSDNPTARMYRTGDRARYLPNGNLVYLGRTDQQVKIRGFRIEPGEIEAHLFEHHQVREAVVQVYGNGSDAYLVAYVVVDVNKPLAHDLRMYLSTLLPDYMVPSAYVCLPSLPLTLNGKLDRRALPIPDDEAFSRQQYEAPQGEMEEKLVDIWRELLGIERISRHDNFFALGGHSLLVVQLLRHLRQNGLDITVREVFDASTLTIMASMLTSYNAVTIPPNLITTDNTVITPEMLPLITVSQTEIDTIIAHVPGGVANIQDIYGLSPLQHGMLFHHIKSERGDPYLIVMQMKFTDQMALERYAAALQQVIARHDIFRSVFIWEGLNEPAQVVLRQVPSLLSEVKLDGTNDTILEQLSQQFNPRHYRLNLTQAPLLRLMAAPTTGGSWVALQLMHHSIIDHSTVERLQTEVYDIIDGKIEKLMTPTPFRHLVAQARLGASSIQHTNFFSKMLGDIDEPTLPFGLSDVSLDGNEINGGYMMLSQSLNDQLRAHARKLQVSLASICHLAWAQVLARASGREAIVFGTVLLGRLQAGDGNNNTMGPTINTLPIRIDIDNESVEAAVRRTHAQLSALLAHEHAPLVLAQRCSGVPVGMPLFSALLNYRHNQKAEQFNASLPGVTFLSGEERTNYPFVMSIEDDGDSLGLTPQVISPISAARIGAYMQKALESLSDALTHTQYQPVRTLTVIPPEERTMLLHTWNQNTVTYPSNRCLHQLFEAQVERDGQAIAVECNGETLSYAELNVQANRLAHYMIAQGIKPDDRIAVCVQRNLKLVVAILGILKAGGAYVPLDPAYPSRRLINILQDANPVLLLTDDANRKTLGDHQIPVLELHKTLPTDFPIDNPDVNKLGLTPNHLAYIIYTSGSTGKPKGVMIEHRNVTNCLHWIIDAFKSEDFKHTSFSTSVNFDMSLYECFAALSMGTTLHVISNVVALEKSSNISMLSTIPSAVATMLNTDSVPMSLCALHLIGEPLKISLIKRVFMHTQVNELCNLYGQTETSFFTTLQRFKRGDEVIGTIGRPVTNTRIYLLDAHGEPVPLGAEGEMYIGGAAVARGYLNRPELTAERFLPDPFSDQAEARIFRSGDRARYLPDGNLVYLGRVDQQVKIRGFRIEPGEIEAHLVEHPQVHEAVVHPYGTGSDARLVAYVVADTDTSLAQNLRSYLLNLLPDYMVPAVYVCLPYLPHTPNGKLDRRALPVPDEDAFVRQQYEGAQGEMEEKLVDIWRELLNIERVSRHDNFFELGGHSLLVMQFINKAKLCNIHITTRCVFSFPILKDLAEQITSHTNRLYCDVAIPVRQHGNETPLFLLPDGQGDISYAFELAHDIDKNIPVYVLPWSSPETKQPSSIEEMAAAMIALMKKIQANGPYSIAGYSAGGILAYEITKQLTNSGCSVSFLGFIDAYPPIANTNNETVVFLTSILLEFPVFKMLKDSDGWARVSELTLNEAVEKIKAMNIDLKNIDIEWEALLSKQRHNYRNICAAVKIDSLPIKTHLFKAVDPFPLPAYIEHLDKDCKKYIGCFEKLHNFPKLGWENYNLSSDFQVSSVNGNHTTMMTDPKNRSLLGKQLTESIQSRTQRLERN